MKKLFLLSILFTYTYNLVSAQNIDSTVRHAASVFMASGPRVGLSVGIIKNNQVYQYHFGSTQKGINATPNDQTIYEIGSVTKTFFSLLLAQAVIEKKVSLSDDIRKYLKGNYPNLQYNGQPIQLVHLANLTSGLPDNLPEKLPAIKTMSPVSQSFENKKFHDVFTRNQFLTELHTVKLTKEPGSNSAHSNTAAQLLGLLLENIYGPNYDALLIKYITGPLKMGSTFFTVPTAKQARYAKGYNEKGILMPEIAAGAGSAGGLKSSLADMLTYMKYQLEEKNAVVTMSHKPTWGKPESTAVGLVWYTKTNFDGKRDIWESGSTGGHSCLIDMYPERNFGIVILTNESDRESQDRITDMAETIYNELYFTAAQRSKEGFGFSAAANTLLDSLNKYGFQNAIKVAADLKQHDHSFKLIEDEINVLGYKFLNKGQKEKALELFKLNVNLYPASSNTYDSLAETYENTGDKPLAIKNYKRALELNPQSSNAVEHLKKLEKE
jgi:D-alanyl-D-alanine-carboxypeptidase/D-alanyl-D-alanine-endopeptidase